MTRQTIKERVDQSMVVIVACLDRLHHRWFFRRQDWPVASGQYYVGRRESPIAISTLGSLDLMRKIGRRDDVAIVGKTFTENLGIEKVVRNIVTNPSIRFLLLCGKESPHRVGQSLVALQRNGIDAAGRIIGSRGPLPLIRNLREEEIERFRRQVEIVDLAGEERPETVLSALDELRRRPAVPFEGGAAVAAAPPSVENVRCWHREAHDYRSDPAGFFTIYVDSERGELRVEHYSNDFKLLRILQGRNALEIYSTLIRNGWVTVLGHAAYLGRELAKAEMALKRGWMYEQNREVMEP